jgi:hypothetical protein
MQKVKKFLLAHFWGMLGVMVVFRFLGIIFSAANLFTMMKSAVNYVENALAILLL